MCRVINVVSNDACSCELLYEVSRLLSKNQKKVCVVDLDFGLNQMSFMFNPVPQKDFKEYLEGKLLLKNVLNKIDKNLYVIKTCGAFNYKNHLKDIEESVHQFMSVFDYIFLFGVLSDIDIYKMRFVLATEQIFVISNDIKSVHFAKLILRVSMKYKNINNQNIILNNYKVIREIKGEVFSKNEIEKMLNLHVLALCVKLCKSKKDKLKNNKRVFFALENNTPDNFDYKKRYRGLIGFFRRRLYERFE